MAIIRGETPQPVAAAQGARTVVVKLARPVGGAAALAATPAPQRLLQLQPGLAVRPYFAEAGAAAGPAAAALAAPAVPHEFSDFVAVDVASHAAGDELARSLRQREGVETAYVEAGPTPPPGSPVGANPLAASQGYLDAAPDGIDARWAWANAAGAPVGFVDLEQGWTLNHQDLVGAGIAIISGRNQGYFGHGTAVLGEVAAVDNDLGVIGIAFGGRTRVVSQFRPDGSYNTAAAIVSAASAMARGDVLLLEAQVQYPAAGGPYHPVEVEDATFAAIRNAVDRGIVVIEAGGNGSVDLDNFVDSHGRQRLNRASADFRDSGAILVGAATSAAPHSRPLVLEFRQPNRLLRLGRKHRDMRRRLDGQCAGLLHVGVRRDVGATPIVTGAALLVQAWAAGRGARQVPGDLRRLLSDPGVNTASASPADRIGVMPNLRAIVERGLVAHPPPVAAPAAVA